LHISCRAAHCFSIAALLGRPGAAEMIDHAMETIWTRHRDGAHGGYHWSFDDEGVVDSSKQGYGHAFVLLAASSASLVGHPRAKALLADVSEILDARFWEAAHGAIAEEFSADWAPLDGGIYRGQNSNMHLCEALMAAFEATGERLYLTRAESIAERVILRAAGSVGWRVAEHFSADWTIDKSYRHANEMFRPQGLTPGHWLEWARLLIQLHALGGKRLDWAPRAARELFAQSMRLGWDAKHGGFFYTLDWSDRPDKRLKLWWPHAEGVGAAHMLGEHFLEPAFETEYRKIWDFVAKAFIDPEQAGWIEERGEALERSRTLFAGKADIYHSVQACLIPLYPATGSVTKGIVEENAAAA
jgi:mannose/cellobiose epimerase-like protein (N-acyl-D-glucosamine 2-epimerase family)